MELKSVRAFVEVVRRGGFSSAARTLFATQSTVSKAVKQLEQELGTPLLDRIGHRSVLTAAGEVVYRRGLKLLADRDDLLAEVGEVRGLARGTLRLGVPPVGSSLLFAPLFTAYRKRYPGVEVRLVEHGSDQLEAILRAGDIDLAGALLPTPPDLDSVLLKREPVCAVLPEGHPLARRRSLTLKELASTPFILFESGFSLHRIILEASRSAGFEPDVVARSTQIDFMVELVAAGLGVAFLPRVIAHQRTEAHVRAVLLDEPGTEWAMAMVWRRGAFQSRAAVAMLDLVRETRGLGATGKSRGGASEAPRRKR
ncbi:MAG: LysR family transcriptional regulator [Steroidobacteraceae bacterium]